MSPPNSYDHDRREIVINGPRPSALQINKHSNVIQKPSLHHRKLPVIIYTHSPKIIHTQPRDFMALVQKLTGFMKQNDDAPNGRDVNELSSDQNPNLNKNIIVSGIDLNRKVPSSDVADIKYDENDDARKVSSTVPPKPRSYIRTFLDDFPLFTPNYSADHVLRYSVMLLQSPNMGNILMPSSSFLDVIKDLPQY